MRDILKEYLNKSLAILLVVMTTQLYAQLNIDLLNNLGGSAIDRVFDITNTSDGNFVLSGSTNSANFDVLSPNQPNNFVWVVKFDHLGSVIWENQYNIELAHANHIIETHDGGFLISGYQKEIYPTTSVTNTLEQRDYWVMKIDVMGNFLWENNYGGSANDEVNSIIQLADSSFALIGNSSSSDYDISNAFPIVTTYPTNAWLVKISSTGVLQWEKTLGGSESDYGEDLVEINNGYLVTGYTFSEDYDLSTFGNNEMSSWLVKTDYSGIIDWQIQFPDSVIKFIHRIIETNDGNYTLLGNNDNYEPALVKVDNLGNIIWTTVFVGQNGSLDYSILQKSNSNYLIGYVHNNGSYVIRITETDPMGNILNFGDIPGFNFSKTPMTMDQNERIILGSNSTHSIDLDSCYGGSSDADIWLYRLENLMGAVYGNVLIDNNNNCLNDTGDIVTDDIMVIANNIVSNDFRYGLTDNLGNFVINVDTNPQAISFIPPSPYYNISTCSQMFQFANISSSNLTDTVNMFIAPGVMCPYLEVDISTPLLRRCFSDKYYISYCNNGTDVADSAYIEIAFDSNLIIDSASIPWTTVVGNLYTFPIGDINPFDCGTFSVSISVPCDSTTFLGQIICTDIHAYPDTNCLPCPAHWCGAELKATAECISSDSVEFTLKNVGSEDITTDVPIIGIEDIILIMDTLGSLDIGEEIKWRLPTNGLSTHRIIAQQPAGHPYKTFTTDAVANCDVMAAHTQFIVDNSAFLAYPHDEECPFIAVDCQPVIGSCDPNDKNVFPNGVGANHFINETTDLEYKIRFQNTGTDTAFTVVIRDSISNLLDLSTFTAGASSHSYTYSITGSGVLTFTYNNIMLPDSFVDEPASRGFVQYKIEQQTTNTAGDIILNNADIFFDFNEPVRTNTTFNEIGGIILDTLIYKFPIETLSEINELNDFNINIYPNPAKESITFELDEALNNVSIALFDLEGKMQQKTVGVHSKRLIIRKDQLAKGMYLFKIFTNEKEIAYGKLIFE